MVKVRIELQNLKGQVTTRSKTDDSYAIELEQEFMEPFKLKVTTPHGIEELEIHPF